MVGVRMMRGLHNIRRLSKVMMYEAIERDVTMALRNRLMRSGFELSSLEDPNRILNMDECSFGIQRYVANTYAKCTFRRRLRELDVKRKMI
jgi:hypothetical protein